MSSRRPDIAPAGAALALVRLDECRPMVTEDEERAYCPRYPGAWAWVLTNLRRLRPFPVSGRLGLYEVDLGSGPLVFEPRSPPVLRPTPDHDTRKADPLRNG